MLDRRKRRWRVITVAAAIAAGVYAWVGHAAESGFPIYVENGRKVVVQPEVLNGSTYLPLVEIVRSFELPYTDALALETFTIRAPVGRIVLTRNSSLFSINDQIVQLRLANLREEGRWLVPVEFLTRGLARAVGMEIRVRAGAPRAFAGRVDAPGLIMTAQELGRITRLTVRTDSAVNATVRHDREQRRAVIAFDRAPLDPTRERIDYRDELIQSIAFDDSDGSAKIIVETTGAVSAVTIRAAEGNRVFFVDFARPAPITEAAPEPALSATPRTGNPALRRTVRVVVIDAGHGGADLGVNAGRDVVEKDLTLTLARRVRALSQARLGGSVLLTRDAELAMSAETRSAVANNNNADVFVSLHAGYSPNAASQASSVYVMSDAFETALPSLPASKERLFLPSYLGYKPAQEQSRRLGELVRQRLEAAIPGAAFPLRSAPLAVLISASMPAVVVELGNLGSPAGVRNLLDPAYQEKLALAIAAAVESFISSRNPRS